jgi:Fic family protein
MTKPRTYSRTHPWITFTLDYNKFTSKHWLLLGEAQSKCEHVANVPLMPEVAEKFYQLSLIKGAQATTAIEGNTLTQDEVRKRIEGKLKLPPSREYLGQEIDNIVYAINHITDALFEKKTTKMSVRQILKFNSFVLKNLPKSDEMACGQFRNFDVSVGNYMGAPSEDCEYLTGKLCDWLNSDFSFLQNYDLAFGIVKAILGHLYLAWIHPFGDGNGRTARLLEYQILLSVGIPTANAHLLSNHYNKTRTEYYRHLDKACKEPDGAYQFIEYALQGFVDGLREQIDMIKDQQLQVHWINYIHDFFREKTGQANDRRKHLLIDLSGKSDFVPVDSILQLSPRIAVEYSRKTPKTLSRDLKYLENQGLIVRKEDSVRGRREIILAFRSPAVKRE